MSIPTRAGSRCGSGVRWERRPGTWFGGCRRAGVAGEGARTTQGHWGSPKPAAAAHLLRAQLDAVKHCLATAARLRWLPAIGPRTEPRVWVRGSPVIIFGTVLAVAAPD